MLAALNWLGARARFALAIGVVAALILPGPGDALAGTIPFWVMALTGLAMMRVNLGAVARRAVAPRRLVRTLAILVLLMLVTPALFCVLGVLAGLSDQHLAALVITSSAPPLGSATAFCLILGLDAAFALELTIIGSFLAPISMPIAARLLLGDAAPLDAVEMLGRLALFIGLSAGGAIFARWMLRAERIDRNALAFDGVAAICLMLFLFPLFDGLTARVAAAPAIAILTFALVVVANLGVQCLVFPWARRAAGRETGGATALIWGNRNAALGLAALPPDPIMTLYVALYQFPLYFTPLVMRMVIGPPTTAADRRAAADQ